MEYRVYEIEVFNDTVDKYKTLYKKETNKMVKNVQVYTQPIVDTQFMPHQKMPNKNMVIDVIGGGTVDIGSQFKTGRTAILNFADALVPGGLVLVGATTQEENICRCSNLYAALTCKKAKNLYYLENAKTSFDNRHGVYLDNVIYARDVLFFKDDETYEDVEPYYMDVITCPAPSVKLPQEKEYEIIKRRVTEIIKSAILNKVDNLILGAWGCGAFGQNPDVVSKAFMEVVTTYSAFDNVIFAIRDCSADMVKTRNYTAFLENCKGGVQ